MKLAEVMKLLNRSDDTIYTYCNKGIIRKIKLDNGKFLYNEDDVKKFSDDQKKILNEHKIVLIDPKKQTIDKTYNNRNEVIDDLKIPRRSLGDCLNHKTNACS